MTLKASALVFLWMASVSAQVVLTRGVYSDPKPLWAAGARLDELHVNAVFVSGGSINQALMDRAKAEGAKVFAEFPTLNGKGYVETHPEAWPINEKGEPAPAASWFMGVCPTDPAFRQFRVKQLEELLGRFEVAGVWLDYFHWHAQFEEPQPILPETCFNHSCLRAFQKASGIQLPNLQPAEAARYILSKHEKAWREWRVQVLEGWAVELRKIVKRIRPDAQLGLYHCAWTDDEFSGARVRILGLDLQRLNRSFDVFSPMVYHRRMGRSPQWVGEYVRWLSARVGAFKVWPIVQASGDPNQISAAEFETVMRLGVIPGTGTLAATGGIMMFTTRAIADDPAKAERLRRLYQEWSPEGQPRVKDPKPIR
ncbi:MAG: hypothetical protein IPP47_29665 [Bryobacterales bacterium]|nr:hypothetical protein [Bryobacterales bacterium]